MRTCVLRFDDSALPALERLLDYLGLEVTWKGDMGIVSALDFDMEAARQAGAPKAVVAPIASVSPRAKPLHPGGTE